MTKLTGWSATFLNEIAAGSKAVSTPKAVGEFAGTVFASAICARLTDDTSRARLFSMLEGFARVEPQKRASFDVLLGEAPDEVRLSVRPHDRDHDKFTITTGLPTGATAESDEDDDRGVQRFDRAHCLASANLPLGQMTAEFDALVTSGYSSRSGRYDELSSGMLQGLSKSVEQDLQLRTVFGHVEVVRYQNEELTFSVVGPDLPSKKAKPPTVARRAGTTAGGKTNPAKAKAGPTHPWDGPLARGRAAKPNDDKRFVRIADHLANDAKAWLTTPGTLEAYASAFRRVGMKLRVDGRSCNATASVQTSAGRGSVQRDHQGIDLTLGDHDFDNDRTLFSDALEELIARAVSPDPSLDLRTRVANRLAALKHASYEQTLKLGKDMTTALKPVLDELGFRNASVEVTFGCLSVCIPVDREVIDKMMGPV